MSALAQGKTGLTKRERVLRALEALGEKVVEQIQAGHFPWVEFPSRSTSNIRYDPELRQYVLDDKKVRRTASNIRHLRPLMHLLWAAYFSHELVRSWKTTTLRDVYYSAQAYGFSFKDQQESNNIIVDLESVIGFPREDFNIFPEERSSVFGDLTVEYTVPGYEGKRLNLTSHPDGMMIGPALANAKFVDVNADKVIAIEKGGLFTRFIEERVHERFNAILIHTAGQAPRATRYFIRRLHEELGLDVYILTDGDPWGMHIAMVIISGSAEAAHLRGLTTPDARWIGVWATDIVKYKLPSDPLTDIDIKRLRDLEKDPRYSGQLWQREIKTFLKHKRKSELEAFSRYGLTYIVDEYLPDKLGE
ncbi:DNA topoisomerase [Candidatus Bathyarchaeota archaeon ex4484_135]|nr:MAG: DNA topoisomerase [Candidatus Bathyarchaeota archaeon ex4484_135]